ncbi:MAG: hypothetical protein FWH26_05325 [Oscillospiraceae bacterium]|nr:hypothetical protein [Oscillospiraceae bacterium]
MLNPALYSAIFQRKSVRQYAPEPLSEEQAARVEQTMGELVPLLPELPYFLELGTGKDGVARVYGYCGNTPQARANLGFALQQLDLALHLQGLGRLWYGFGREPKDVNPPPGMKYAICLKLGNAAEEIGRAGPEEFNRKAIADITADAGLQALFEPVRLAPSAMNYQPWYFTREGGRLDVFCKNPVPVLKLLGTGSMNQVDIGIGLCHAVLALEHAGYTLNSAETAPVDPPKGYYYMLTLRSSMT